MSRTITIFNSVSLDGAVTGFPLDLEAHYKVLGQLAPETVLVGSNTAKTGIETFIREIPPETEQDRKKPDIAANDRRAYWIIPDSRGVLKNMLHVYRQTGYGKDIIMLISESTPADYRAYLEERHYDCIVAGKTTVDLPAALEKAAAKYDFRYIVTDTGPALNTAVLEAGLGDEIKLLVWPAIAGKAGRNFMEGLKSGIKLQLLSCDRQDKGSMLLSYKVCRAN